MDPTLGVENLFEDNVQNDVGGNNETNALSVSAESWSDGKEEETEKPFKCKICPKSFSYKCNMYTHLNTHTGKKPFRCNTCSKSFAYKSNLNAYIYTHTDEKPFNCNICSKSISHKHSLINHRYIFSS
jgi:hypothetical protein